LDTSTGILLLRCIVMPKASRSFLFLPFSIIVLFVSPKNFIEYHVARKTCSTMLSRSLGWLWFLCSTKNSTCFSWLQGLNGKTCYCLIVCHFSSMVFGESFQSKAPPLDFLNWWLVKYGLPVTLSDKYVHMDQGGELGNCPDIIQLFESAGYSIELMAPNSSHQNGPGKRPHRTIGDATQTMLAGACLEPRFWPYAFCHFLHLYNVIPHRPHDASPFLFVLVNSLT